MPISDPQTLHDEVVAHHRAQLANALQSITEQESERLESARGPAEMISALVTISGLSSEQLQAILGIPANRWSGLVVRHFPSWTQVESDTLRALGVPWHLCISPEEFEPEPLATDPQVIEVHAEPGQDLRSLTNEQLQALASDPGPVVPDPAVDLVLVGAYIGEMTDQVDDMTETLEMAIAIGRSLDPRGGDLSPIESAALRLVEHLKESMDVLGDQLGCIRDLVGAARS